LNFAEVAASINNNPLNNNKNASLNYQQGQVNVVITAAEKTVTSTPKQKSTINYLSRTAYLKIKKEPSHLL